MKQKIQFILLLVMGLVMIGKSQSTAEDYQARLKELYKNTVPLIQPAELQAELDKPEQPLLLDTRAAVEYDVSHIKGAIHVGFEDFDGKRLRGILKDHAIVVYCSVGYRSERIGEQLLEMGFTNVRNLYGGIFEWMNQRHAVYGAMNKPVHKVHGYSKEWGKWLLLGQAVYPKPAH